MSISYRIHTSDDRSFVIKTDENGVETCCTPGTWLHDEYLEWLAEGNDPLPAD